MEKMGKETKKLNFGLIMAVYLLGIFMGAIDTGIVTPARTVIQSGLGVDATTGIWMITIYTLAYAASIPVIGKLADKYGRKYIYLFSIFMFGLGSLLCGLSQNFGSFEMLLIARVIQAIGGGGILPVATAEFGTTFPKEKRGMALGLVGGVYGIANIFGSSAGSAILDIFGKNNWQFIFYINVPITIFILIAGFTTLPNTREVNVKKIDIWGIVTLVSMILSLLYGLKKIDFFDFTNTVTSTKVFPFFILFFVLLPFFILAEKKAEDPVINLNYFKNPRIVITLLISIITGIVMMGMIFVPQFSENALKIASGSGGYFVIILGVFAGVGAPISGKLIDKYGVKVVLGFGFLCAIAGSLFLIFVTIEHPSFFTVAICLVMTGLGIGFTMGTPLNYMMLDNTDEKEASSAMAAVSLVRSIGTAIAPAIMIGFISHAGGLVQGNIMAVLPSDVAMPKLPYVEELKTEIDSLKTNEMMASQLQGIDLSSFEAMLDISAPTMDMSQESSLKLPTDMITMLQGADVTTITEDTKTMTAYILSQVLPPVVEKITTGIDTGITGINIGITQLDGTITQMQATADVIAAAQAAGAATTGMPAGTDTTAITGMPAGTDTTATTGMPAGTDTTATTGMPAGIDTTGSGDMTAALEGMKAAETQMQDLVTMMTELKAAVPTAFDTYQADYLTAIDNNSDKIESVFQTTLNEGFKQIYMTVTIASALALVILLFYKKKDSIPKEATPKK